MNTITLPNRNPKEFNDYNGFFEHCDTVALILNHRGITPHRKHSIRDCIREASNKVTAHKGGSKKNVDFISYAAALKKSQGVTDGLIMEHVVTISYINDLVLKKFITNGNTITAEEVMEIVSKWTIRALVTKEEDIRLRPTNKVKDFQNPTIRYQMVEPPIKLIAC